MSEVKRYWVPNGTLADQSGWHQDDSEVVQAWAFDRVTAERDALQVLLTAADERADVLAGLLCDVINEAPTGFASLKVDLSHRVNDALKPAEVPYAHSGEDDFGHREREQ